MYVNQSYEEVEALVKQALLDDEGQALSTLAEQLNLSEGELSLALPSHLMSSTAGEHALAILQQLPSWGPVTTIVHSHASIFEFKKPFPKGQVAHGYYNIMGKEGLHGHLRLDLIKHIAFISKPFKGIASHYIGFFTAKGESVFKVYLGRDKKRQLISEQIAAFATLKQEYAA